MTANKRLIDLLCTPLDPNWTVETLAEQLLDVIATQPCDASQEFVLDLESSTDHQFRRLLRPLFACLATKSTTEAGLPTNLYGGSLAFKRLGPEGTIWILGHFENQPGNVCLTLRRSHSSPEPHKEQAETNLIRDHQKPLFTEQP